VKGINLKKARNQSVSFIFFLGTANKNTTEIIFRHFGNYLND